MANTSRKRSANYSEQEKRNLLAIINKYSRIIENKSGNGVITKEKQETWQKIAKEYNASGALSGKRDWEQLRHFYGNMKQKTRKKLQLQIKTDISKETEKSEGSDSKLDVCDMLVLEIIDKESSKIQGIDVHDPLEQYDEIHEKISNLLSPSISLNEDDDDEDVPIMRNNATEADLSRSFLKKRVFEKKPEDSETMEDLKKRKLELEIRKLQLEVWEKEKLLQVDHCAATINEVVYCGSNDYMQRQSTPAVDCKCKCLRASPLPMS